MNNEELKAQYERDIESGYKQPWWLYKYRKPDSNHWVKFDFAILDADFLFFDIQRLPNADQIILEWQREKYAEDAEWHPRPWELWEYTTIDIDSEHWKRFGDDGADEYPIFISGIRYRRRPDAPTRAQWEVEQKGGKMSIPTRAAVPRCAEKADKCATCRHKYELKPRTIHVRMQFPDGKLYEADLPEPMREAPGMGEVYHIVFNDMSKFLFTWVNNEKEKRWLKQGMIHRTEADAQVWVDFFKQWRNDK